MRVALLVVGFGLLVLATLAYWLLVYCFVGAEGWYHQFPYVSPVADTWMAGTGLLAAWGLLRRRAWARAAGLLSAGACIFVALTAFHYNLRAGHLFSGSAAQWIESIVPASLLLLGIVALGLLGPERRIARHG